MPWLIEKAVSWSPVGISGPRRTACLSLVLPELFLGLVHLLRVICCRHRLPNGLSSVNQQAAQGAGKKGDSSVIFTEVGGMSKTFWA